MGWNNRIFRHVTPFNGEDRVWFALHETYYDDQGKPNGWTKEPMCGGFESIDDMIVSLEMMLRDAKRFQNDVLEYKDEPDDSIIPAAADTEPTANA